MTPFRQNSTTLVGAWIIGVVALILLTLPAVGQESKYIAAEPMATRHNIDVSPDGKRVILSADNFLVYDDKGMLERKIGYPLRGARGFCLFGLDDGRFIRGLMGLTGHVSLCRPDGTEIRPLIRKGPVAIPGDMGPGWLRQDMTGGTSPTAMAVDPVNQVVVLADVTMAPRDANNTPDPDWSRIALWDFEGNYLGDINRYDARSDDAKNHDERRTWYYTLAVDGESKRIYTIQERYGRLVCYDYSGKELASADGARGVLCAMPKGRVALAHGTKVTIFDRDLAVLETLTLPPHPMCMDMGIRDITSDASGRLYMALNDEAVTYARWSADFKTLDVFLLDHLRVVAEWPRLPMTAGGEVAIKVRVQGQPAPTVEGSWQFMIRPGDGSDLTWRVLSSRLDEDGQTLKVTLPATIGGNYECAVRFGEGVIDWTNRDNDPYLQRQVLVVPKEPLSSVTVVASSLRTAFRQGERVGLQVVRRGGNDSPAWCWYTLKGSGLSLESEYMPFMRSSSLEIPAEFTRRLAPGEYTLTPIASGHKSYPLTLYIVPDQADSPMQRILYHEFANAPNTHGLADDAERVAYLWQYFAAARRQGWTRETDREFAPAAVGGGPNAGSLWRTDGPASLPIGEFFVPTGIDRDRVMDWSVRFGLYRDSQVFGHCLAPRVRDVELLRAGGGIQRFLQSYERFPSLYGVNYNDEMFFDNGLDSMWTSDDTLWLDEVNRTLFPGRPRADAFRHAQGVMYGTLSAAVRQAVPRARTTTTPMWQFPAVEGSYAPTLYKSMDESYSHFLSEVMATPFYALHSVEFLRRPDKPLMGVFDNGYEGEGGEVYMKNAMLVLGRGVQGVGVEHTAPLGTPALRDNDPFGADVYRVTNLLAAMYGPVFAECPLADEAAVLYSYEQDITEKRNLMGTPQWEGVYAMTAAGAMAGLPTRIVYEEDLAADVLLDGDGKVKIPMLFLIGLKADLPEATRAGIARFVAAGGQVYIDTDCKDYPDATRLNFQAYTDEFREGFKNSYCVDAWYPELMPPLETLAKQLRDAVGDKRRMKVDTSDLYVAKSFFDGGAVRYVMLASETSPFPWDAPTHWSLGGGYNKRFLSKSVTLSLPTEPMWTDKGVVYDVFEHKVVAPGPGAAPTRSLNQIKLPVDLRNYPGRLYALAPAELGTPELSVTKAPASASLSYTARVLDKSGNPMAARVPFCIRLLDSQGKALLCFYRGSDAQGLLSGELVLPVNDKKFQLEVCELLGGSATRLEVECDLPMAEFVKPRAPVEAMRTDRVDALLQEAGTTVTLVAGKTDALTAHQKKYLARALVARKITLVEAALDDEPKAGVYLTAWLADEPNTRSRLADAIQRGALLSQPLTSHLPGPGNGLFSAVYNPRGGNEHCIALVAGDEFGLSRVVDELAAFIENPVREDSTAPVNPAPEKQATQTTRQPAQTTVEALRDMTGIKLGTVMVSSDGKRLVVSAPGYQRNLALIQDDGQSATVVKTTRLGQGPAVASLFITDDGQTFGGVNSFAQSWVQGLQFFRLDGQAGAAAGKAGEIITSFGEHGVYRNTFAVSGDGQTVVAPGPYGVVCWNRDAKNGQWSEAWAVDYWKEFDNLTWEVSSEFMRIPRFNAFIPPKSDVVLVTFSELTDTQWVMPRYHGKASLAAYDLKTGQRKWQFDVPIPDAQLFVDLAMSPSGQRLLLRTQIGGRDKVAFRYYSLNLAGEVLGAWAGKERPTSLSVSDSGRVVSVYKDRLVEVRDVQGRVEVSQLWDGSHPLSATFLGETVYVTDDAGVLSRLDGTGRVNGRVDLGGVATVTAGRDVLYTAQWNGRLKSFTGDLQPRWDMDMTAHMTDADPVAALADSMKLDGVTVVQASRPSTTSDKVPAGENLLAGAKAMKVDMKTPDGRVVGQRDVTANDKATIRVGGTPGWLSGGKITVKPEQLVNGQKDDVTTPWIPMGDLETNAWAGRHVWVEIEFKQPTDVSTVTVYENPKFPASFPREGQIMIWNDQTQDWDTVTHSVFMTGPVNTYAVNLKGVTKLRYVPWHSLWRNFYTSEIEVR